MYFRLYSLLCNSPSITHTLVVPLRHTMQLRHGTHNIKPYNLASQKSLTQNSYTIPSPQSLNCTHHTFTSHSFLLSILPPQISPRVLGRTTQFPRASLLQAPPSALPLPTTTSLAQAPPHDLAVTPRFTRDQDNCASPLR